MYIDILGATKIKQIQNDMQLIRYYLNLILQHY